MHVKDFGGKWFVYLEGTRCQSRDMNGKCSWEYGEHFTSVQTVQVRKKNVFHDSVTFKKKRTKWMTLEESGPTLSGHCHGSLTNPSPPFVGPIFIFLFYFCFYLLSYFNIYFLFLSHSHAPDPVVTLQHLCL